MRSAWRRGAQEMFWTAIGCSALVGVAAASAEVPRAWVVPLAICGGVLVGWVRWAVWGLPDNLRDELISRWPPRGWWTGETWNDLDD